MLKTTEGASFSADGWTPYADPDMTSRNPANTDEVVYRFSDDHRRVEKVVEQARRAHQLWALWPLEERIRVLEHFATRLQAKQQELASLVVRETGKVIEDANAEARASVAKVGHSIRIARKELTPHLVEGVEGYYDLRPLGVIAVIGPYNFPLHLPNGHLVPALLAGNAVIFKPSPLAPACGHAWTELWQESAETFGVPEGLVGLVHGDHRCGEKLVLSDVDGIAFTGSYRVGVRLRELLVREPQKLLALELGGNNPVLIDRGVPVESLAKELAHAALSLCGQRCTATRHVYAPREQVQRLAQALATEFDSNWVPGPPNAPSTKLGPLISASAREVFLSAQEKRAGLETIRRAVQPAQSSSPGYWVTPALHVVRDPTQAAERLKAESFGPELFVHAYDEWDDAIEAMNQNPYGLAVSIYSADQERFFKARAKLRYGVINLNRPTAGASSALPFGGLGHSGNHRPAGAWSLRYCVAPVATLGTLPTDTHEGQ